MSDFSREDFERMKQAAAEQVLEMHKSRHDMPPFPSFVRIPSKDKSSSGNSSPPPSQVHSPKPQPQPSSSEPPKNRLSSLIQYINLPELMKNSDSLLLLGLIFLLSSESADEKLILALAYILL